MSAEYKISSIADFLAVPHEKQSDCLRDFETWLNMARQQVEATRLLTVMLGEGLAFETGHFFWIDDGIPGVTAIQISEVDSDRSIRLTMKGHEQ